MEDQKILNIIFIFIIGISFISYIILRLILNYKFENKKLKIRINRMKKDQIRITPKTSLKEFEEIDTYLNKRLMEIFNSFTLRKIIPIMNEFSSISEGNRNLLKEQFMEHFEFITTDSELEYYKKRYPDFNIFKFKILDFFLNKLTKLELLCLNKFDLDKTEFADFELYKSLFSDLDKNDIKNIKEILSTISDTKTKKNKE